MIVMIYINMGKKGYLTRYTFNFNPHIDVYWEAQEHMKIIGRISIHDVPSD